jgi:hypothetical protein
LSQSSTPLSSGLINGQTLKIELVEPGNDLPNAKGGRRRNEDPVECGRRIGRPSRVEEAVNAAEARRACAAQAARRAEVDYLAAQLSAHLKWLQENPDAVSKALTRE